MNVAENDQDVSGDPNWWLHQLNTGLNNNNNNNSNNNSSDNNGSSDTKDDVNNYGQPGFTINERKRFKTLCERVGLMDPWVGLNCRLDSRRVGMNSEGDTECVGVGDSGNGDGDGGSNRYVYVYVLIYIYIYI